MHAPANALPSRTILGPVAWVGRSVTAIISYVGGVTLLAIGAAGAALSPAGTRNPAIRLPGFFTTLIQQLGWMLIVGFPIVGMVHIALGSFLSLQAYYGSTFVDGTGAVVGVGLLRNLGGLMTGLTFSGILAGRLIPELRILTRRLASQVPPSSGGEHPGRQAPAEGGELASAAVLPVSPSRLAAPRVAAAGIACLLLSQWGVVAGTVVGWQASQSMMGLPTETFFMMLMKMMWFRDVVGLIVKGLFFGVVPAAICCYEGVGSAALDAELSGDGTPARGQGGDEPAPPWSTPVFRAYCLSCAAVLVMNASWFILVYHAVPFYGPTLLAPPGP
jgi:phospholipid/cholesterol/gamma-HCH transport system permease protein